jgi:hypothetical protein
VSVTALIVILLVAVSPKAEAITVTAPADVPVTVVVNTPLTVGPEDGLNVTLPAPVWLIVTVAPETALPPEFLGLTVRVTDEEPLSSSPALDGVIVTVDPVICIGIIADAVPEVAVIVAVRSTAPGPDSKVTVALPVESVMMLDDPRIPTSAVMIIFMPDNKPLDESIALTVIVVVADSLEGTVGDEAEMLREAAEGVVGVVPVSILPPHPLRQQNRIKKISSSAGRDNLAVIDFTIFTLLFPRER